MTDNVCEDCGMWEVAHTEGHLSKVCLPAKIRKLSSRVTVLEDVVEGCRDVFAQFCGESGPVIAHPPKCGFYTRGKQEDCNCTAKNTANDVLLSLKACREVLNKPEKPKPGSPDDTCIPKPTGRALQYCSEYQKTSHDHSPTCTFWKRVTHGTS